MTRENPPDGAMCCRQIYQDSYSTPYRPCQNAAKVREDGHDYCGVHDPQKRRDQTEARRAQAIAQKAASERAALVRALGEAALAAGLDTPEKVSRTRELEGDVERLRAAVCRPGSCPACGAEPDGEWFEGGDVKCPGCGVMLNAAVVKPCFGSTHFVLAEVDRG